MFFIIERLLKDLSQVYYKKNNNLFKNRIQK